ncbi:putative proteolipid membrane potential modulator [Helianthus annuus]|uniref:Proteolipid membrane potential modulator n=1 Tax=Helianthus annuus TaxID=4232 RepID=A0A251SKJ9_HELAN|nr:salt stress-induced hydrophobic peptide ESI3 [Helianthus annuus]KAF5770801.1 putative proteolipid membrane potential modulator [Helianthus annuus]KAJ0465669.1 putative proteolipid membrane potential modulator [Helianthus annuus]KAJ0470542.1 putative proteolipid membrane potential modulator [Helianthus annuus]KAJ0487261.1 putative proteolipid membrane potential modulator [Helianthus annuus]KAJ0657706.1 putative proteolipid membrane potential modulator [Helianthus annuus]
MSQKETPKPKVDAATIVQIILAIFLPPLGVFLRYAIGMEFWICLLLTILGYLPGIIYAIYVLLL